MVTQAVYLLLPHYNEIIVQQAIILGTIEDCSLHIVAFYALSKNVYSIAVRTPGVHADSKTADVLVPY